MAVPNPFREKLSGELRNGPDKFLPGFPGARHVVPVRILEFSWKDKGSGKIDLNLGTLLDFLLG